MSFLFETTQYGKWYDFCLKLINHPSLGLFSLITLTNDLLCMLAFPNKCLYLTHVTTYIEYECCLRVYVPQKWCHGVQGSKTVIIVSETGGEQEVTITAAEESIYDQHKILTNTGRKTEQ